MVFKQIYFLRKEKNSKLFLFFSFKLLTITGNITLDPDPDLDPHPNWAKFLDPDPNSIYLDPQHWWLAWLLTWQTPSWVRGTPSITPRVAFFFIGVNAFFTFDSLS